MRKDTNSFEFISSSNAIRYKRLVRHYRKIKHQNPGALVLLRDVDSYLTMGPDAQCVHDATGVPLITAIDGLKWSTRFALTELECLLTKLINSGYRVVIVDELKVQAYGSGIDPRKNFLLKQATELARIMRSEVMTLLFRKRDGSLFVLSKSVNPLVHDQLNRIDAIRARAIFKVRLS